MVATATGVGAPVGAALGLAALGVGAAGTLIDCAAAVDASCKVSIATTALGVVGLGAAGKAAQMGWNASRVAAASRSGLPMPHSVRAENWANAAATADLVSSTWGGVNLGAATVANGVGVKW